MKNFLPPQHGYRFSKRSVPVRSVNIRTPKDFPWKALDQLVKGFDSHLNAEDRQRIQRIVRCRDFDGLTQLEKDWSPQCMALVGMSIDVFNAKYQLSNAIKKYPFNTSDNSKAETAKKKFKRAEEACAVFNRKGYMWLLRKDEKDPYLSGFLDIMRRFISSVITPTPPSDFFIAGRHGPGSSLCTEKGRVTPYYKWSDLPYTVTQGARSLAIQSIESDPRWIGALNDWYHERFKLPPWQPISRDSLFDKALKIVDCSRITFVPKTRHTDRSIAIEPRMNLFLQLAVDSHIRTRLKRFGCDLDSQQKNQDLALEGSLGDRYATLDLSAASDTISMKLIELLFPPLWYDLLTDLRCPKGRIGRDHGLDFSYEKLSSMGNGFTFAVESLIFLSVCYACITCYDRRFGRKVFNLHRDVAVYGDDIVVPAEIANDVISLLNWCGFRLNREKSFIKGPFRESCGKDFFNGTLVRPLNIREITDVTGAYSIINRCTHRNSQCYIDCLGEDLYTPLIRYVKRLIPERFLEIEGPPSFDDTDSYIQVPRSQRHSPFKNGLYSHFRLVKVAKTNFRANKFFFRKLMALNNATDTQFSSIPSVSSDPPDIPSLLYMPGIPKGGGGNVFAVTQRNAVHFKLVEDRTSYWFDHPLPPSA